MVTSATTCVGSRCGSRLRAVPWAIVAAHWDYRPCAGGLSAVNTLDTQIRGPISSGLTKWRLTVKIGTVTEGGRGERIHE